jgi:hypothetical protein
MDTEHISDISIEPSEDAMSEAGDDMMSEAEYNAMSEAGDGEMNDYEMEDDKALYSDNDTESAVSDIPNILEIEDLGGPEWHIRRDYVAPQPDDLSHGALIWSIHYNALTKKSFRQWYRFFFHGNRMKTIDPEFLAYAYKLKSALWFASDGDYHLYHYTYAWTALRMMGNLQMFTRPYFFE